MNLDLITQPLPSRSTLNQTFIWFYMHIKLNSKYIVLNFATTRMYIENVYKFLIKSLFNALYINNNSFLYVMLSSTYFFIFTTEVAEEHNLYCYNNQYDY